jgi:hypothetical protein
MKAQDALDYGGRELILVGGKDVAAGMAFKVIEHAGIDFLTHACTGQAANSPPGQATENGPRQTTQDGTDRPGYCAECSATLRARHSTGRAGRSATYGSGSTANFAGIVAGSYVFRITERAVDRHHSDSWKVKGRRGRYVPIFLSMIQV